MKLPEQAVETGSSVEPGAAVDPDAEMVEPEAVESGCSGAAVESDVDVEP